MQPQLSLIVPTRGRLPQLRRFLESLVQTAAQPKCLEIVVVVDADDPASADVVCPPLAIRAVTVPPGLTMGALNMAGYDAAAGRYLMLLNDDVVARTPAWDTAVLNCLEAFPDEIILVHVNDTVFQKALCTFPIVSRRFCELAGGMCPTAYRRYRIDDHIEDIFNMLGVLGERRTLYLPGVIFEHFNHVTNEHGVRQYFSDPEVLAVDAPLFERLAPHRKELALRLKTLLRPPASEKQMARWRRQLDAVVDSFSLRKPERLRVVDEADWQNPETLSRPETWWRTARKKIRTHLCNWRARV